MINPEARPDFSALREKLKDSAETKPKTNLQKDYKKIDGLMRALENPAPGMDRKLQEDKEQIYAQFDLPKNASLETIKIAFGHAVEAEKIMNTNETAKESFLQAGIESPYRIARVAVEYNVLADEVGDLKEAGLSNIDLSEEAKVKMKKFEDISQEWEKITDVMQEYVIEKKAMGDLKNIPRTTRVTANKRRQGEKNSFSAAPGR